MNKKSDKITKILAGLTIIMLAFILHFTGVFSSIDKKFIDFRLSMNNDKSLNMGIIRLHIDDLETYNLKQYKKYTEQPDGRLSNETLARLVDFLEAANPKLILINLSINDYDKTNNLPLQQDESILTAINKYSNLIVSTSLNKELPEEYNYLPPDNVNTKNIVQVNFQTQKNETNIKRYINTTSLFFINNKINFSASNIQKDDKTTREAKPLYKLIYQDKEIYVPSMAFYAFLKLKNLTNEEILIKNNKIKVKDFTFNTNGKEGIYLNLKRRGLYYQSFPAGALLQSCLGKKSFIEYNKRIYHLDDFKNKILIIENTPSSASMRALSNRENYTEGEITALELDNYLEPSEHKNKALLYKFSKQSPMWLNWLTTIIFCCSIIFLTSKFKKRYIGLAVIWCYFVFIFAHYTFTKELIPVAIPLYLMIVFSVIVFDFPDLKIKQKENKVTSVFKHQVSKNILTKLQKQSRTISLKPEKKFITAVFFNIDNFTKLCENNNSDVLVCNLNNLLEIIETTILKYDGTINKLSSNSIIAYWGAPLGKDDIADASNALASITAINDKIKKFYDHNNIEKSLHLNLKISLHSGEVIAGNIGTNISSSYSAFGETIHVVQQISKIAEQFDKNMLVSQTTYDLLKNTDIQKICKESIKFSYAGTISVKIKTPYKLTLYELQKVTTTDEEE